MRLSALSKNLHTTLGWADLQMTYKVGFRMNLI